MCTTRPRWVNIIKTTQNKTVNIITEPNADRNSNIWTKTWTFLSRKCIWKHHLQTGSHFVQALMGYNLYNTPSWIQCGAVIMRSTFSQIFTKDTHSSPYRRWTSHQILLNPLYSLFAICQFNERLSSTNQGHNKTQVYMTGYKARM